MMLEDELDVDFADTFCSHHLVAEESLLNCLELFYHLVAEDSLLNC